MVKRVRAESREADALPRVSEDRALGRTSYLSKLQYNN